MYGFSTAVFRETDQDRSLAFAHDGASSLGGIVTGRASDHRHVNGYCYGGASISLAACDM